MDGVCFSSMYVEMEGVSCGAADGWRGALALGCGAGGGRTLHRLR